MINHIKEFWEWYFNLFSDNDNKVVIAAWSCNFSNNTFCHYNDFKTDNKMFTTKIFKS